MDFDNAHVCHGPLSITGGTDTPSNIHNMDIVLPMMIQIISRGCQYAVAPMLCQCLVFRLARECD